MKIIFDRLMAPATLATLVVAAVLVTGLSVFADSTFTANQTVANVSIGTDNQTDSMASSTDNTAEVKAGRSFNVTTAPVNGNTITLGTCTITFSTTTAGSPAEDANCTGGATILTTTGTSNDIARTAAQVAAALRTLTNVSDTGHGALTIGNGTSTTSFTATTTSTEASASAITFTDGTSAKIVSLASTVGVVPVAQINTITIGGTVETGDVFSVVLPGPVTATYTVLSSDTTVNDIATGFNAAIQASSGYSSQAFTSAASTDSVVLTAKATGTGFVPHSPSTTNRSPVAQVVTFTPADVDHTNWFQIAINDNAYETSGQDSIKDVVEVLKPLVDADSAVSCTEDDTAITCTAESTGTAFTYSATAHKLSGGGGGGGGGTTIHRKVTPAVPATPAVPGVSPAIPATPAVPASMPQSVGGSFSRALTTGVSGDDVKHLQQILNSDPATRVADTGVGAPGSETNFFGGLTLLAVERFQVKHGIAAAGDPGYGFVGPKTRAKLNSLGL